MSISRIISSALLALPLLFGHSWTHAQTERELSELERGFLSGEHAAVVQSIEALVKRVGSSPRLESIRSQSLAALGHYDRALISILQYEQMVGTRLPGNHPGHAEMLALKEWLQNEVKNAVAREQAARKTQLAGLAAELDQQAKKQWEMVSQRVVEAHRRFDEKIDKHKSALSVADLRYLILTGSGEKYSRLDTRALELPLFQSGIFRVGLPQRDFEQWLLAEVHAQSVSDRFLKKMVAAFRPKYIASDYLGKSVQRYMFLDPEPNFYKDTWESSLYYSTFLTSARESIKVPRRHELKVKNFELGIVHKTFSGELRSLVPGARFCFLSELKFYMGEAIFVEFGCRLPSRLQNAYGLHDKVIETYGPPTRVSEMSGDSREYTSYYAMRSDVHTMVHTDAGRNYYGERNRPITVYFRFYKSYEALKSL